MSVRVHEQTCGCDPWSEDCGLDSSFFTVMHDCACRPGGPDYSAKVLNFWCGDGPVFPAQRLGDKATGQCGVLILWATTPAECHSESRDSFERLECCS